MAAEGELCWAVHEFIAENHDEISFAPGEAIVVLEKDDQYGDGWWQGRNARGDIGLFPRDYTSSTHPASSEHGSEQIGQAVSHDGSDGPPVLAATMSDLQNAIDDQTASVGSRSIRDDSSSIHHDDDDHGASPMDYSHGPARAVLAAKAKDQLDRQAQAERDASVFRKLDEERFRTYGSAPPIDNLEMSDESDDDVVGSKPSGVIGALSANGRDAQQHPTPRMPYSAVYDEDDRPQELMIPDEPETELRSASILSGSKRFSGSHSQNGLPPSSSSTPIPAENHTPSFLSRSISKGETVRGGIESSSPVARSPPVAPSPRLSGIVGQPSYDDARDLAPEPASRFSTATSTSVSPSEDVSLRKASVSSLTGTGPAVTLAPATQASSAPMGFARDPSVGDGGSPAAGAMARALATPDHDETDERLGPRSIAEKTPGQSSIATFQHATPASQASTSSRPQSHTESSTGVITTDLSSHSGSHKVPTLLPRDPTTWNVNQVVEWGRQRGFDQTVLSKFQEHEISGDVLLELDLNTLKEIDLPAFGRRVHIYNAIKELKKREEPHVPVQPASGPSPTMSGYEPDTPSSRNFSPRDSYSPHPDGRTSFASSVGMASMGPARSQRSSNEAMARNLLVNQNNVSLPAPATAPIPDSASFSPASSMAPPGDRRASEGAPFQSSDNVKGLGLQRQDGTAIARSQSMAGSSDPVLASSLPTPMSTVLPTYTSQARPGHGRSVSAGTADSFHSATNNGLQDVEEEPSVAEESVKPSAKAAVSRSGTKASTRSKRSEDLSTAQPSSPETGRFGAFRSSFSDMAAFARARKAPPKAPSSTSDSEKEARASRRSTRLFGFGSPQPTQTMSVVDPKTLISSPLEAPPRQDGTAAKAGGSPQAQAITSAAASSPKPKSSARNGSTDVEKHTALLEQIGTPDLAGWLRRKSERYAQWKNRYVILKGRHLYAMKSEDEQRVKTWVDLVGYKVVPDPDSFRGNYGFKLVHSSKQVQYFSSDDPVLIRQFMKALMKSSITRDYSVPVQSSNNIQTIPLAEAQAMFPPPRPPSPSSRARAQQLRLQSSNPNTLSPKDAEILMSLQKPGVPIAPPRSGRRTSRTPNTLSRSSDAGAAGTQAPPISPRMSSSAASSPTQTQRSSSPPPVLPPTAVVSSPPSPEAKRRSQGRDAPLLRWVNEQLASSMPAASDLSTSFRSGQRVLRLAEALSGQTKGISDARFESARPDSDEELDLGFDVFDFLTLDLNVDTGDVSVGEMLRGERPQVIKLVEALKAKYA